MIFDRKEAGRGVRIAGVGFECVALHGQGLEEAEEADLVGELQVDHMEAQGPQQQRLVCLGQRLGGVGEAGLYGPDGEIRLGHQEIH